MNHFSYSRTFSRAWQYLKDGFWAYFVIMIVALAVLLFLSVLSILGIFTLAFAASSVQAVALWLISPLGLLIFLGLFLLTVVVLSFIVGLIFEVTHQVAHRHDADLELAFEWMVRRWPHYFLLVFWSLIGIAIGTVLFVVPGIMLAVFWMLGGYLVAKEGLPSLLALKRSQELVNRSFGWSFLVLLTLHLPALVFQMFEWRFVSELAFLLAFLGLGPVTAALYEELHSLRVSPVVNSATEQPEEPTVSVEPAPVEVVVTPSNKPLKKSVMKKSPIAKKVVKKKVTPKKPATKTASKKTKKKA